MEPNKHHLIEDYGDIRVKKNDNERMQQDIEEIKERLQIEINKVRRPIFKLDIGPKKAVEKSHAITAAAEEVVTITDDSSEESGKASLIHYSLPIYSPYKWITQVFPEFRPAPSKKRKIGNPKPSNIAKSKSKIQYVYILNKQVGGPYIETNTDVRNIYQSQRCQ